MQDQTTADVKRTLDDRGRMLLIVNHPKVKNAYIISKSLNGYSSYEIKGENGRTPKELQGSYTVPDIALKFLLRYLDQRKESTTVRRDKNLKDWKNRNASTTKSDDQDQVQQGSAD